MRHRVATVLILEKNANGSSYIEPVWIYQLWRDVNFS